MSRYPQIIVTGDSIAQLSFRTGGYGSQLVDRYQGKIDVLNRGMGGYNSRQLLQKFQDDLVPAWCTDVRLFLIHIGTNDSAISALQTIPLDDFRDNLRQIISFARKNYPSARIVLLTPSTLDPVTCEAFEDRFQMPKEIRSPRLPANTTKYVDACVQVGTDQCVAVVNCFKLHEEALKGGKALGDLFEDGLHYSPQGYSYINKAILDIIDSYPELGVEQMPNGFPDFWLYASPNQSDAKWLAELFAEIRRRAEQHFAMEKGLARVEESV